VAESSSVTVTPAIHAQIIRLAAASSQTTASHSR
jgi:hypothetical protein